MSRIHRNLIPFLSLAALGVFQVPARSQTPAPQVLQIIYPAAGKAVPAVQLPARNVGLQAGPNFLSWKEKVALLKAKNLYPEGGGTPGTTINLTIKDHVQTVNGIYVSTTYAFPMWVYPDNADAVNTGRAAFSNSTEVYPDGSAMTPTLELHFRPLPNKRYLIDAPMAGNKGTYYIYVRIDGTTAFQQIMPNADRLLIFFPGLKNSIESQIKIRGSIPGLGHWYWIGCQITEL